MKEKNMTAEEWLRAFARRLQEEVPDSAVVEALLDIAGEAAHASERKAAPIACYLVGLAGADPQQVLRLLRGDAPGGG